MHDPFTSEAGCSNKNAAGDDLRNFIFISMMLAAVRVVSLEFPLRTTQQKKERKALISQNGTPTK
jgi:hypothetical protein